MAQAAETRKHQTSDEKCYELGWACIALAIETWMLGHRGKAMFVSDSTSSCSEIGLVLSEATASLYGRLSLAFIRANARAILYRTASISGLE